MQHVCHTRVVGQILCALQVRVRELPTGRCDASRAQHMNKVRLDLRTRSEKALYASPVVEMGGQER